MADGFNEDITTTPTPDAVPQNEQGEQSEPGEQNEPDLGAGATREDVVDAAEEMAALIETQQRDIEETTAGLDKIRASLGIETSGQDEPASPREQELKAAQARVESVSAELAAMDSEAFGSEELPDGEEIKKRERAIVDLERLMEQDKLESAAEQKKWREDYVQEFIDSSGPIVIDHFSSYLDDAENGEAVKEYIPKKLEAWIGAMAQRFIDEGGEPDFGYWATIKVHEYDNENGEKVSMVTGFELSPYIPSSESEGLNDEEKDEEKLVTGDDKKKLATAEEEGDVTEEKKK